MSQNQRVSVAIPRRQRVVHAPSIGNAENPQRVVCVLAYHLLIAIEKNLLDQGIHTSWASLRDTLYWLRVSLTARIRL
jgi:hypothetical protein